MSSRQKGANPNKDPDLQAEKKAAKAERDAMRKRAEEIKKASWKYGLGGGGAFIGCMCLYSLVTISRASIATVRLDDASQLKEVFFGGEPWMLQCANENVTIGEGFLGASKRLSVTSNVKFGTIDCNGKLPSNKTFWQRFGQVPKAFTAAAPVGFLFANNNDPLGIPEKYINDAKKLSEWAEKYSKPSVQELSWTKTFKKHCLSRDVCVQLHTKGKFKVPSWMRGVMGQHMGLKFVSINRKLHKTSFDHVVRTPRADDTAKVAIMRRHKEGNDFSYTLTPHKGEFTEKAVMQFIKDIAVEGTKTKDTMKLDDPIWFDTPPKDKTRGTKTQRSSSSRGGGGGGGGGSSQGDNEQQKTKDRSRDKSPEDKSSEAEKARLDAAKNAESQLSDDDDVVVSDIDEDEDDGLV